MNACITKHAEARMQQRGVTRESLDLLLEYGARAHAGKGAEIVYFDKKAQERLMKKSGNQPIKPGSKQLKSYAVCKGAMIVTVGKLYKRVKR
jgi:hypothetical protein